MLVGIGLLLVAVLLAVAASCTDVVPGTGTAADPLPTTTAETEPDLPPPSPGATTDPGPSSVRSSLAADVLDDECLLDAVAFSDLLGQPVLPPEQVAVQRDDGSVASSCYAHSARGFPTPLAAINVYAPRSGTPAEFVRSGPPQGRWTIDGIGEAAVLVDTAPGVTLQLAGARYLITISVLDGAPSEDAWKAAARAALTALG